MEYDNVFFDRSKFLTFIVFVLYVSVLKKLKMDKVWKKL